MHWRALEAKEKVLRRKYLFTLISVNNLKLVLLRQGKCKEAKIMYWWALEAKEKVLRHEHLFTLASVYYLTYLLY